MKYAEEASKNAGLQLKKSLPPFPNIGVHQLDKGWSHWPEILAPLLIIIFMKTLFSNFYHLD